MLWLTAFEEGAWRSPAEQAKELRARRTLSLRMSSAIAVVRSRRAVGLSRGRDTVGMSIHRFAEV
eukprot:scaffold570_cov382-Prasinococcus_capsulatus_cf.AAC.16